MLLEPIDSDFSPARSLFKRCKQCNTSAPECPVCPEGSTCTMNTQTCDECATTKCISTGGSQPSDSGGSNTGAIVGGVIGGVAAIGLLVFLVWWFVIRKKRQRQEAEKNDSFTAARSERQSIASTVLTRASNVIQIAYIPGVTNRSPPETPGSLVPPVPPLPGASPDQHFFMPGDLRDSSWTTTTGHQSISPTLRSSVATTIYRNDAVVSAVPAQQIQRSRAAVVSIHNGGSESNSPSSNSPVAVTVTPADAPAVPAITSAQLARAEAVTGNGPCVARSVTAKPVMVRGPSLKTKGSNNTLVVRVNEIGQDHESKNNGRVVHATHSQFNHDVSTFDCSSSDEDEAYASSTANPERESSQRQAHRLSNLSGGRRSNRSPPARVQSPFSDANEVK